MTEDFNLQKFAEDVEQTAVAILAGNAPAHLGEVAKAVQEMSEIALARHRNREELIACGPGCGHCCQVNVAVLEPEIQVIKEHLSLRLTHGQLVQLRQKAAQLFRSVVGLSDDERIMLRQPCLFLSAQGECSIYPVRPLLCRGMTSTDPERCRNAIVLAPLGEAPTVIINLFQKNLFDHAFQGLATALNRLGLDSRSRKLSVGIHRVLQQS